MKYFSQDLHSIKQDYWLMLVTLFFMKIGQFMLLPFLAIFLAKQTHLTAIPIGIVIGIGPLIYGIAGLIAGAFVDRFGVKITMILSLFLGGTIIFFFFKYNLVIWYLAMNIIAGITRSFFDVASRSYAVSNFSIEIRRICFGLRFMAINSAAAIGPILGAYFASIGSLVSFKIIGILYCVLGLIAVFVLRDTNKFNLINFTKKSIWFHESIIILFKDTFLQILLVIGFIFWVVYSQLDTTLAQYLNASLPNGVKIYSLLLIINAIGCAATQIIVTQLTKKMNEKYLSYVAMSMFAMANLIIALFLNIFSLISAAIIIVFAETIIMPLNDFILARIAPSDRIGTYYGIVSVSMLGLGVGPMFGGFVYAYFGPAVLFLMCGIFCIVAIFLYKKLLDAIVMREQLSIQY